MAVNSPFSQLLQVMSGDQESLTPPSWLAAPTATPSVPAASTAPVVPNPKDQPTALSAGQIVDQLSAGGEGPGAGDRGFGGARGPGPGARGTKDQGVGYVDTAVGLLGGLIGGPAVSIALSMANPNSFVRQAFDSLFGSSAPDPGLFGGAQPASVHAAEVATSPATDPSTQTGDASSSGALGPGGAVGANPGGTPGLGTGDAPGGAPGGVGSGIGSGTGQGSSGTGVGPGGSGPGGPGIGSGSDNGGSYGRGGKIQGGSGPGRKVKIDAHEGEGVLTRKSMSLIGEKTLERINTIAESKKPDHAKLMAIKEAFQKMKSKRAA